MGTKKKTININHWQKGQFRSIYRILEEQTILS